ERSVVLANGHDYLGVADLPEELREMTVISDDVSAGSFHEAVQGFKKELVRAALRVHSGNRLRAAVELGISRCYLHRLLNQFNLADDDTVHIEDAAEVNTEVEIEAKQPILRSLKIPQ